MAIPFDYSAFAGHGRAEMGGGLLTLLYGYAPTPRLRDIGPLPRIGIHNGVIRHLRRLQKCVFRTRCCRDVITARTPRSTLGRNGYLFCHSFYAGCGLDCCEDGLP